MFSNCFSSGLISTIYWLESHIESGQAIVRGYRIEKCINYSISSLLIYGPNLQVD